MRFGLAGSISHFGVNHFLLPPFLSCSFCLSSQACLPPFLSLNLICYNDLEEDSTPTAVLK